MILLSAPATAAVNNQAVPPGSALSDARLKFMDLESYTLAMGKIVVNLHSLEFALRTFLWNHEAPSGATNWATVLPQLQVGQSVPVNAFSNYDTLGKLIETFNAITTPVDGSLANRCRHC
jgi:hypothetical protein